MTYATTTEADEVVMIHNLVLCTRTQTILDQLGKFSSSISLCNCGVNPITLTVKYHPQWP